MIAKELQEDFENKKLVREMQKISKDRSPLEKGVLEEKREYDIEERYRYRYTEVDIDDRKFLAKKSCKGCHGTGVYCFVSDSKAQGELKRTVRCSCLVRPKRRKKDAKKKEE